MIDLYLATAVADDYRNDDGLMSIFGFEGFDSAFSERIVEFVFDEVDGTPAETSAHDTGAGDTALFGDIVEEIQLLATDLVLLTQALVRAVHLTTYLIIVSLEECIADSEYTVFFSENEGSTLDIFGRTDIFNSL